MKEELEQLLDQAKKSVSEALRGEKDGRVREQLKKALEGIQEARNILDQYSQGQELIERSDLAIKILRLLVRIIEFYEMIEQDIDNFLKKM